MHHYRQIKYMLTVREHMGSHPGVGGVRISHLCRFLSRACVCVYVCVCVCVLVCVWGRERGCLRPVSTVVSFSVYLYEFVSLENN